MLLSNEQLETIVDWKPVVPGFGRDEPLLYARIQKLQTEIEACDRDVAVLANGGLSNYISLFIAPMGALQAAKRSERFVNVEGATIMLSLLMPIAVVGTTEMSLSRDVSAGGILELDEIIDRGEGLDTRVRQIVQNAGYEFAGREELSQRLPSGISPYEYCLCREPWDRVFHVLFADTD